MAIISLINAILLKYVTLRPSIHFLFETPPYVQLSKLINSFKLSHYVMSLLINYLKFALCFPIYKSALHAENAYWPASIKIVKLDDISLNFESKVA